MSFRRTSYRRFQTLIADYANVSRLLIRLEKTAIEYKYLLYPTYPRSRQFEEAAYKKIALFLKSGRIAVREDQPRVFAREVFKHLDEKGLLDKLAPYFSATPSQRISVTHAGYFKLSGVFREYTPDPNDRRFIRPDDDITFVVNGKTYLLSRVWADNPRSSFALRIDELIKMMNYVYPGQFDIQKTGTDYIMID
jgi:hypothetical protein